MSWRFRDWDDWGPKKSARNPQHSDPPKVSSQIFGPSRICSIHFGNVLVEAKAAPFRFLKAESPTKTEPNLWCFRFLWGSAHFLKGYGMIRPMFMLEEKMIPNNLANIPSMSVFQDGASQFFLEINIKIFTDILGSTKILVLMVPGKGVRKCVVYRLFVQSHFTLNICYPKPIYGIQYNFTLPGTRSCESSYIYITTTTASDRSGLRPCLDVLFPCCFSDPLIAVGYSLHYTNYSRWLQSIWTLCMQCDTIVTSDVFIQRSEWSCHLNTKYIFIRRHL